MAYGIVSCLNDELIMQCISVWLSTYINLGIISNEMDIEWVMRASFSILCGLWNYPHACIFFFYFTCSCSVFLISVGELSDEC